MNAESASGDDDVAVVVTSTAADEAVSLPEGEPMGTGVVGPRLFIQQDGCAGLSCEIRFDNEPGDDDVVVKQHGLHMFVSPTSINYIGDSTPDFEGGL